MHFLHTLLVSLAAVFQTLPASAHLTRSEPLLVRAVIDGDTIDVATVGRVRLLGIDAPEIGRGYDTAAPFAREARERLTSLIVRRWVRLEQEDGAPIDVYARRLAYVVTEDGVFVNALMVREGLARVSARGSLVRFDELKKAESEAQLSRRGMWSGSAQIPSASYTPKSAAAQKKKKKQ